MDIGCLKPCSHWINILGNLTMTLGNLTMTLGNIPMGKLSHRPHLDLFDSGKLTETMGKLTELAPGVTFDRTFWFSARSFANNIVNPNDSISNSPLLFCIFTTWKTTPPATNEACSDTEGPLLG